MAQKLKAITSKYDDTSLTLGIIMIEEEKYLPQIVLRFPHTICDMYYPYMYTCIPHMIIIKYFEYKLKHNSLLTYFVDNND